MTSSVSNRSDVDNHNNNPSTKLSPEQQEAVLFWPLIAHIPIIPCDSQSKQVHVKEWQKMNLDKVDYKQNLQKGLYDNGIAIRLGAALNNTTTIDEENSSSTTKLYSIALDFDKWEGIAAWFGDLNTWDHVVESSKKTRTEWHGNKEKIHYIFLAQRPIANKKITKLGIEVRCENNLLFCSPSIHEDGNQYVPLGTDKIASLDETQLQKLEVQIDTLCSNYISDQNRQTYIRWLEDPSTKLGEGEGRHPALVILGTSYFYRYNGEWGGITDDQRKAKLWEWNRAHCNPPKSEIEFNQIWGWVLKYHRKTRDQLHEKLEDEAKTANNNKTNDCAIYDPYVAAELQGNVFYEINEKPPKFIIANNQNKKLIEAKIQTRDTRIMVKGQEQCVKFKCLVHLRTYLTCIPIKITRHKNPLAFLDSATKYTMAFVDATGEHTTFKHKALSEILAGLRDRGYVLSNDGSEGALGAMIQAYKERKIIEDNNDIEYTGFFLDEETKKIIASNIKIDENILTITKVADSLALIDEIARYYQGRLDLLSTAIIWAMVAPLNFVIKSFTTNTYLKWPKFWGITNASKSSTGRIMLAIDRHHTEDRFLLNMSNIDTIARLGEAISKTTFPKLVDEADLNEESLRHSMINHLKSAIESKILRTKLARDGSTAVSIPSLCPLILTSNAPPPYFDSAFMKRIIDRNFPITESYKESDPIAIEFREFLRVNLDTLGHLGDFRNWYIMNHQDVILDKKTTPMELGRKILAAAYKYARMEMPEWFNLLLPENQLEESLVDNCVIVKRAFEAYIQENFNHAISYFRAQDKEIALPTEISDRLVKLVDARLLPDIKRDRYGNIIIYIGILESLYKYGINRNQLPSLKALAEYIDADYTRFTGGKHVVKTTATKLGKYFDVIEEEEDGSAKVTLNVSK